MRYDVLFPDGKTFEIGSMLVCSDEKLTRLYPRFVELDKIEKKSNEQYEEYIFEIVKMFNPDAILEDFLVDLYTGERVLDLFTGSELKSEEKKSTPASSEDTSEG